MRRGGTKRPLDLSGLRPKISGKSLANRNEALQDVACAVCLTRSAPICAVSGVENAASGRTGWPCVRPRSTAKLSKNLSQGTRKVDAAVYAYVRSWAGNEARRQREGHPEERPESGEETPKEGHATKRRTRNLWSVGSAAKAKSAAPGNICGGVVFLHHCGPRLRGVRCCGVGARQGKAIKRSQ